MQCRGVPGGSRLVGNDDGKSSPDAFEASRGGVTISLRKRKGRGRVPFSGRTVENRMDALRDGARTTIQPAAFAVSSTAFAQASTGRTPIAPTPNQTLSPK